MTIKTTMQGTCLQRIVDGRSIGTAKKFPVGWVVKSNISRPWQGRTEINRRPHMTNVKVVGRKQEAIDALCSIEAA
jgi:hypothetical protein